MDKRALESLGGGTTEPERRMLLRLAKQVTKGQIVEIGSYVGGSTIYLAKGAKQVNRKVYAIDPHVHGTESEFMSNIQKAGCGDTVIPIIMKSEDAAKTFGEPVGLLFIDGLHDYDNAKGDFVAWQNHLVEGKGFIVFHDCWSIGVAKVIGEMLRSGQFSNVRICQGLLSAVKRSASYVQRLKYQLFCSALLAVAWVREWLLSKPTIRRLERKFRLKRRIKGLIPHLPF